MRTIFLVSFLLSSLTIAAQEIKVFSQKDDDVDFREYETYFWARQVDDQLDGARCFLNDLLFKADVRNAVHQELQDRGFRLSELNADLLVNFRVFDRETMLKGSEDYGAHYWGKEEYITREDAEEVKVKPGTLIISLLDRANGRLVWQGFATGLIKNQEFIKDEGKIQEAVTKIFEEYAFRIDEYTKR